MRKRYLLILVFILFIVMNVVISEATSNDFYYDGLPNEVQIVDNTPAYTPAEPNIFVAILTVVEITLLLV